MTFATGALVRARGREWVVLPGSSADAVLLRPLGGTEDEVTGILPALEPVSPAQFAWPDPSQLGDHRSARLLRDALRLGFRSSAGPFRSFGHLGVDPRPYQLVPLLMALRLDPVRLLIADDVGIGKTVEAALVARELLDVGQAHGLAVLCPPHLAEQWQAELSTKVGIEAELVLAGTAARLERGGTVDQTIFDRYPHVVVSTDFIKSDRRREEFLRTCPDLVIVDEAHTCAADPSRGARHQRHQLVAGLARDRSRHLLLVTATPHSGNEGAFRSLVGLLDPALAPLVDAVGDAGPAEARTRLARHLVQRRRRDLAAYLGPTPFPTREEAEVTYRLHPDYRRLLGQALAYAHESVADPSGGRHRQRVRWWSALALLRALASSPAAAAATLRARADAGATTSVAEADAVGALAVLDLGDDGARETVDVTPGADPTDPEDPEVGEAAPRDTREQEDAREVRRRLRAMARAADALRGAADTKLREAERVVDRLLADGFAPIVFCRFIDTAEYVAAALQTHCGTGVAVAAVTGRLPPEEREARVTALHTAARRVLVATDCLSEGVNLQDAFTAVIHYDLAWNPTRHEQRDGRVDRYGQAALVVRSLTLYGADNQIDAAVLKVLLRKQRAIRNRLGIFVPVPGTTEEIVEALFARLFAAASGAEQLALDLDDIIRPVQGELDLAWDTAADREARSRTRFAQAGIRADEVAAELAAVQAAVGSADDVAGFVAGAITGAGGRVDGTGVSVTGPPARLTLTGTSAALVELAGGASEVRARFTLPVRTGEVYLSRAHPFVEGLAALVLDGALDPLGDSPARRAGVIRTAAVARRTTLLLLRLRFDLVQGAGTAERTLLAEDAAVVAFEGPPTDPVWLEPPGATALLEATPAANVSVAEAAWFVGTVTEAAARLEPALAAEAARRAEMLRDAHRRVRAAAGLPLGRVRVQPHPPDVLGVYVLLPVDA